MYEALSSKCYILPRERNARLDEWWGSSKQWTFSPWRHFTKHGNCQGQDNVLCFHHQHQILPGLSCPRTKYEYGSHVVVLLECCCFTCNLRSNTAVMKDDFSIVHKGNNVWETATQSVDLPYTVTLAFPSVPWCIYLDSSLNQTVFHHWLDHTLRAWRHSWWCCWITTIPLTGCLARTPASWGFCTIWIRNPGSEDTAGNGWVVWNGARQPL